MEGSTGEVGVLRESRRNKVYHPSVDPDDGRGTNRDSGKRTRVTGTSPFGPCSTVQVTDSILGWSSTFHSGRNDSCEHMFTKRTEATCFSSL